MFCALNQGGERLVNSAIVMLFVLRTSNALLLKRIGTLRISACEGSLTANDQKSTKAE